METRTALPLSGPELAEALTETRRRTLALVEDLDDEQLLGPKLKIVNPLLWEIGHVAWFQERWTRRHLRGLPSLAEDADALYDSMAVAHDTRWDLPVPPVADVKTYMKQVLEKEVDMLQQENNSEEDLYLF